MVLKKKIEKIDEVNADQLREELISKGGHVVADLEESKSNKKEWVSFCLRIRVDMLHKIDLALESRVGISKTGWILEAIHEKLMKS